MNIGQLLAALSVRVLSEDFNTDNRKISWVCRSQTYVAAWCVLTSMIIICLAVIDQYISMNIYRHYCSKQVARRAILPSSVVWGLYCIYLLLYWDAPAGICTTTNPGFAIYVTRFQFPALLGFLPVATMTRFSLSAFHSARTLIRRQINIIRLSRDRQLTVMTLCHIVFVVVATLSYIIFFIYSLNQIIRQDPERIAHNNLIYTITALIDYSIFSVNFFD